MQAVDIDLRLLTFDQSSVTGSLLAAQQAKVEEIILGPGECHVK